MFVREREREIVSKAYLMCYESTVLGYGQVKQSTPETIDTTK